MLRFEPFSLFFSYLFPPISFNLLPFKNELGKNFEEKSGVKFFPVKEVQGHKPLEVLVGALLGAAIAVAFCVL